MKRSEAINTFDQGLLMDLNPIVTPNNVVTNCLNGTLITYNGNENVLQNDMGNGRVETASLPQGYVPLGTAELGGIIYIVSYNPLIDRCQIGSFPSPERNIAKEEILDSTTSQVSNENFVNKDNSVTSVTSTLVKVKLLDNMKLNPGDKFIIYGNNILDNKDSISDIGSTSHKVDSIPRYVTIRVVSIGDDGKITYLDDSLKWTQLSNQGDDYYIKQNDLSSSSIKNDIDNYNTLISSAYNVFKSKVSGQLALLFELKTIDSFTATWNATVSNYDSESYQKQGNISVDLNWASQFPSINPKAVKITNAKVTGNIGLLRDGKVLKTAKEIEEYLNSLTYTFNIKKVSTTIKPKSIGVIRNPIRPELSESSEEIKQDYIDSKFESDLTSADIIILNGEYLRTNDGKTDKPISVQIGQFLYGTENPGTISFTVTPIMPYGDLSYLSVSNIINLSDVGTGKVNISRWKYFVNDSQTFIDFGISAYPEMGCSIDKVFLAFISIDTLRDITSKSDYDLKKVLDNWNTIFEGGNIFTESPYIYELPQQTSYSGQHNVTILPENVPLDRLHLVDICAKYYNPNDTTGNKITYIHNFRWLFTSKQFNDFYLRSDVVDFNDIYLNETIDLKVLLTEQNSISVRTDSYFPNLTLDEMPQDTGQFSAMGVNVHSINFTPEQGFSNTSNYKIGVSLDFNNNNLLEFDTRHLETQGAFSYDIIDRSLTTDINNINTENVIYPKYDESLNGLDKGFSNTIKDVLKSGSVGRYNLMQDQFNIIKKDIQEGSHNIELAIQGAAFSKVNSSIIQKQIQIEQTIRPLLLYTYDYSKFGFKQRSTGNPFPGTPILKYLYGEGHKDLGEGEPFMFSFAYIDAEKGDQYSSSSSSGNPSDDDIPKPIRWHSSSKSNWNPADKFYYDNYWDNPEGDTLPYTDYLNQWMLNAGGPFQLVLYNKYNYDNPKNWIQDLTLNKPLTHRIVLYVKTSNNHYVPVDCSSFNTYTVNDQTFYQTVSLNLAAVLMQIYYVDTTPSFITKYVPNEINNIDNYKETISFDVNVKIPIYKSSLLDSTLVKKLKGGPVQLRALNSSVKKLNGFNINTNNINIQDNYEIRIDSTKRFSYTLNIDTTNLYQYFNTNKTLSIKARYIVPISLNPKVEDGITCHYISEGYIEPLNPNHLYVVDTSDIGTIKGFKLLTSESLNFYYPKIIRTHQNDDVFDMDKKTIPFKDSSILYLIPQNKLMSDLEEQKIFEHLIWKDGDATFDEDKLLAASERRVFLYHTNASDGDYSGARYSSNSRYQFPNIFMNEEAIYTNSD